jgi:peptide-methionine (R)-S-oxide reductase
VKSDSDWLSNLKPDRYAVLRKGETERPFSGKLLVENRDGWYVCAACGLPLFKSDSKFDSHCGWPSFDSIPPPSPTSAPGDTSHGMVRTEIYCARCGSHLGHVFDDGPTSTGLRYCVNSLSLDFKPMPALPKPRHRHRHLLRRVLLGGGEGLLRDPWSGFHHGGLHRGPHPQSHLPAGLQRDHRACRGGGGGLRSRPHPLPQVGQVVLPLPRPHHSGPPRARLRPPVPVGGLLPLARAGEGSRGGARFPGGGQDLERPRGHGIHQGVHLLERPRTTTRSGS